jgi:DNA modification methylase
MNVMKQYHDKYFDLAIVDPPYGGVGIRQEIQASETENGFQTMTEK